MFEKNNFKLISCLKLLHIHLQNINCMVKTCSIHISSKDINICVYSFNPHHTINEFQLDFESPRK